MLDFETRTGQPVVAEEVRLVPIVRTMRLGLGPAALVWARAVGVSVRSVGGVAPAETLPIRDDTRRLQLAMFGAGLLGSLLLGLVARRRQVRRR